jgi:effector-binding domain-containing protein
MNFMGVRLMRHVALATLLMGWQATTAFGQTVAPPSTATPAMPKPMPSATPPTLPPTPTATPVPPTSADKRPGSDAPTGKPGNTEIEPNGSPGIPDNATTESVTVAQRPIIMVAGKSSYDDAFKSIKASIEIVKAEMAKTGLKAGGHPITIFSEPDDKGFKYKAGTPLVAKPDAVPTLGGNVTIGESPGGKAIKFQHRGAYEDIDSTYDVITAYLDAKGLQVDNPYIEEYLTDLTTADDPNLQVDIYVFVK